MTKLFAGNTRWKWILLATATVALGLILFVSTLPRPTVHVPPSDEAAILLRPFTYIPPDSYQVTSVDFERFPIIARVFQAYGNPQCCIEARIDETGTLIFLTTETQGMPVTEYLIQQFEAQNPDPARSDTLVLAHESSYFSWGLSVP